MPLDLQQATDADLLACFAAGRDQRAFAEIVRRHGPMVMAVATRLLGNRHDAEDAFQAAFLALARAAGKLRQRAAVVAWLHRTTVRAARSIQRMNTRWKRNVQEQSQRARTVETPRQRDELRELLDLELAKLPPKLRSAVVLCDLEGLSRNEAAQRLGVTASTLRNHVADGRRLLRRRLTRRGVGLSVAALASHLAGYVQAAGSLPESLTNTTTVRSALFAAGKSASAIGVSGTVFKAAQGVITAMTVTKFSMMSAAALAIVLGATAIERARGVFSSLVQAETIFVDHFDDGNAMDGAPVSWSRVGPAPGSVDASSGDYVFRPSPTNGIGLVAAVDSLQLADVSIRAQIRADSENAGIGLVSRGDVSAVTGYHGGIDSSGGMYILQQTSPPGTFVTLASTTTDLRPITEDVLVQFDTIGDVLSLYAWRPGESRPRTPQLRTTSTALQAGSVALVYAPSSPGQGAATFRYVHVADTSIPEPSTALLSAIFFAGVFAWQWRRSG